MLPVLPQCWLGALRACKFTLLQQEAQREAWRQRLFQQPHAGLVTLHARCGQPRSAMAVQVGRPNCTRAPCRPRSTPSLFERGTARPRPFPPSPPHPCAIRGLRLGDALLPRAPRAPPAAAAAPAALSAGPRRPAAAGGGPDCWGARAAHQRRDPARRPLAHPGGPGAGRVVHPRLPGPRRRCCRR